MDAGKLLAYLKAADEMEHGGAEFYKAASGWVKDGNGKALLLFLVKEEERHALVVEDLIRLVKAEAGGSAGRISEMERPHFFRPISEYSAMVKDADTPDDVVFREAALTEQKSIDYYQTCTRIAGEHAGIFRRLVAEEKGHLEYIRDSQDSFKVSGYWLGIDSYFSLD